jgi:hypothetical protein
MDQRQFGRSGVGKNKESLYFDMKGCGLKDARNKSEFTRCEERQITLYFTDLMLLYM